MRRKLLLTLCLSLLLACSLDPIRIELAPGWHVKSLAAWRHAKPQQLAATTDGHWLYVSFDSDAGISRPSLAAINLRSGRQLILLNGLHKAHTLKQAPDKSLWIGEAFNEGMIWRIAEPDQLPEDQRIERSTLSVSHPSIAPLAAAGRFTHAGIAFSDDGRYAYMTSSDNTGRLFRYAALERRLEVLGEEAWLTITTPESALSEAEQLGARSFGPLGDAIRLPDGRIVIAEPERGRLLQLKDSDAAPALSDYLSDAQLDHPSSLLWDAARNTLWIGDSGKPSHLWRYDGNRLETIGTHRSARIGSLSSHDETIFFNLGSHESGPEITLKLTEQP